MNPLYLENPQFAKIVAYLIANWQWMLLVLCLSIIGLGWPHQMDEQP